MISPKKYITLVVLMIFFISAVHALASATVGSIDPSSLGKARAQFLDTALTNRSINTGNFASQGTYNVVVTDTQLSGYMWSEGYGWIVLNCSNTQTGCVSGVNGEFKVSNNGEGVLSGYAWGAQTGWINFGPFTYTTPISQVKIGANGNFGGSIDAAGYAWSQNYGWIVFDCGNAATCTNTDWRPISTRSSGSSGGSAGGNSGTPATGTPATTQPGVTNPSTPTNPPAPNPTPTPIPTPGVENPTNPNEPGEPSFEGEPVVAPVEPTEPPVPLPTNPPSDTTNPISDFFNSLGLGGGDSNGAGNGGGGSSSGGAVGSVLSAFTSFNGVASQSVKAVGKGLTFVNENVPRLAVAVATSVNPETVAPAAVATSVAVPIVATLALNPFSLADIALVVLRLWSVFLTALGIKKRHRPWGTVYDSVTKQPIDPAYVVLMDAQGKEIATSITDMDGRYGFVVPKGTYTIVANKTNYTFPSVKLSGTAQDELYDDLYFASTIVVENDGDVITKNIPMDAQNFDWNEFEKNKTNRLKFYKRRDVWFARFATALFWVGLTMSIIGVLVAPTTYNIAIFILSVIVYILRVTGVTVKPKGSVVAADTDQPMPFSIVRVMSAVTGKEIIHKVADQTGQYYCLLQNGTYTVNIDKKNSDQSYTTVPVGKQFDLTAGYLKEEFKI